MGLSACPDICFKKYFHLGVLQAIPLNPKLITQYFSYARCPTSCHKISTAAVPVEGAQWLTSDKEELINRVKGA